jgi:peptidoglycan/LPS O-acetylase OafA/YrhL
VSSEGSGWDIRRLGYRRGFDGIRALGVFVVLATHGKTRFLGGFIGLDMFFVLSGFLITSLLLEEWWLTGRVDRRAFYGRRARRLLPALLTTVAGVGVLMLVMPGLDHGWPFVPRALAIVFYAGNWVIAVVGSGAHNPLGMLDQTWSLAVEEQFYIVWPLIFLVCMRRRWGPRGLFLLVIGAAAASALWRAYLFSVPHSRIPFGPYHYSTYWRSDTHADGLALGCALAVAAATSGGRRLLERFCRPTALVVVMLVFLAFVDVQSNILDRRMYLGGWVLVDLATAFLIAHIFVAEGSTFSRCLSLPPLVWIGKRSYGIYLVHLPIFFVLSQSRTHLGVWPLLAVRMAVSFAVAGAMFRWIESYFLRRKRYSSPVQTREPVDDVPPEIDEKSDTSPVAVTQP